MLNRMMPGPRRTIWTAALLALAGGVAGCARGPFVLPADQRVVIDRSVVEYPGGFALTPFARGLTAPTAFAFDTSQGKYAGALLIAESGDGGNTPRIIALMPDRSVVPIFPKRPTIFPQFSSEFAIFGPIGGITVANGTIYVSHRDGDGRGVITAFDYEGNHTTVVADLPAQGDYGVTDLAIHPNNGRLYFGVGAATNSGVVGLDNWQRGWVKPHPQTADDSLVDLKLLGYRFTSRNPAGGWFGGDDIAVTAPFQPFGASRLLRITPAPTGKPSAAIYSVNAEGGDLRVEAHGIRNPRGLAFNEFGNLYVTNDGMELRGTRPVKDDPDVVLRVPLGSGVWFGWPDFSADLQPITLAKYQPPEAMLEKSGYPEVSFLIDHEASALLPPDRNTLLRATLAPQSGAARMALVPGRDEGAFGPYRGSLLVALQGDRAPFANDGQPSKNPVGYAVVQVDPDTKQVRDFIHNTRRQPGHEFDATGIALERPIDVTFGPDGALYVLDYGQMEMRDGKKRVKSRSGKVYRLSPLAPAVAAATDPTATSAVVGPGGVGAAGVGPVVDPGTRPTEGAAEAR